jgi:hypothetical protein
MLPIRGPPAIETGPTNAKIPASLSDIADFVLVLKQPQLVVHIAVDRRPRCLIYESREGKTLLRRGTFITASTDARAAFASQRAEHRESTPKTRQRHQPDPLPVLLLAAENPPPSASQRR